MFYGGVLLVFLLSVGALLFRLTTVQQGAAFYRQLSEETQITPTNTAVQVSLPIESEEASPVQPPESLRFSLVAEEYPGAVFWLHIPDTSIDYPVMQGSDNQFYLDHLPDGSYNSLGSLFLDYRIQTDGSHLIIYGHNSKGGRMFGQLKEYVSQEYFLTHATLTLTTAETELTCPIFSVRYTAADSDAYTLAFSSQDDLSDYIRQAAAQSLYAIDVPHHGAEGIVTLSTCTGEKNQRLIVQALIVR